MANRKGVRETKASKRGSGPPLRQDTSRADDSGNAPNVAPQGRRCTPEENVVFRLREQLEGFVDRSVPGSWEAFTMAYNAIRALVLKEPGGLEGARRWSAWVSGFKSVDSDARKIVWIEWAVRIALDIRHGDGTFGDRASAASDLRAGLVSRFGEQVPSANDLEGWLDRHAPKRARGKVTTAGIVAHIVHEGRLLGTAKSYQAALDRVTKDLDRKRHPRW
jgi:hypothetical protein